MFCFCIYSFQISSKHSTLTLAMLLRCLFLYIVHHEMLSKDCRLALRQQLLGQWDLSPSQTHDMISQNIWDGTIYLSSQYSNGKAIFSTLASPGILERQWVVMCFASSHTDLSLFAIGIREHWSTKVQQVSVMQCCVGHGFIFKLLTM